MKKQTQRTLAGTQIFYNSAKKHLSFEEALRRTQKKHAAIIRMLENN